MEVNLLIIATNKYICFLENLLDSVDLFFLKDSNVFYNVFTDRIYESKKLLSSKSYFKKIKFFEVDYKPFPYSTLYRFHFFKEYEDQLSKSDYNFYIDVDCIIKKPITETILNSRVAVQHCGYVGEVGTYEINPRSVTYVQEEFRHNQPYYGGGFWGFSKSEFWKFIYVSVDMIDVDERNHIVPLWHDESVLNRYLINNPPTLTLTPDYHYPENNTHIYHKWELKGFSFKCVILLLDKNHNELRS